MPRLLLAVLALALAAAPAAPPAAAQPAGRDLHVVQAGETLFRIARANGLAVDELRRLNALDGDAIQVGQTLRLSARVPMPDRTVATPSPPPGGTVGVSVPPRPTAPAATGATYVVQTGDTLYRIAVRNRMTVDALRRLNNLTGDQIEVGQRLVVSGEGVATAAPPGRVGAPAAPVALPAGRARTWSITRTAVPADEVHFVDPGETLYSIASMHRLTIDELAADNVLTTAPLVPGTMLYLPRPVEPAVVARRGLPPPESDGLALVYPDVMRGRTTASGEVYDPLALTASHRDYPLGTVLLVTNPANDRSTFVRVIDRGPVSRSYLLELSAAAATALELDPNTARRVDVRLLP